MYFTSHFRRFDWVLFSAVLGLVAFGLSAIFSTSAVDGGQGVFWKQLIIAGVGAVMAIVISFFNYRMLSGTAKLAYFFSLILLITVLAFGSEIRGTKGWFSLFGLGIQPVEIVKILLVIFLAKFMSDYARDPVGLKRIVGSGIALAGVFILVMLQPDFGSAMLLVIVWGSLLLLAGIRTRHLLIMATLGLGAFFIAWTFLFSPYQRDRLSVFINPESDPLGSGWNVTQSVIAIGSGQFFGRGLGFGSQSQLNYLPEHQTDFIFAAIAEELGFFGVIFLMGFFGVIFYRAYRLASTSHSDFAMFLVIGITISLAAELLVNVGANLRLLPLTGVTLPFVSAGGSSLMAKFVMIGILESVAVRRA